MSGFLKRYASAQAASEALRRSDAVRACGVPTPSAQPGPAPDQLVFEPIAGRTGHELIDRPLAPLLRALAALHAATVPDLPSFDPLLRIRPRLEHADPGHGALRALAGEAFAKGTALVHGDLHVGQFIVTPSGAVWLVDLDDLAIGPPEADLANFTAHLATTRPGPGIAGWIERIRADWASIGGAIDAETFIPYLRLALLRRHLKLRAAGRRDFGPEILAYLRDRSSFSMR